MTAEFLGSGIQRSNTDDESLPAGDFFLELRFLFLDLDSSLLLLVVFISVSLSSMTTNDRGYQLPGSSNDVTEMEHAKKAKAVRRCYSSTS